MPYDGATASIIKGAYFPYAKAFLSEPSAAKLTVIVDDDDGFCYAALEVTKDDYKSFDVHLSAHHRRVFNRLVRWVGDDSLSPLLDILPLP